MNNEFDEPRRATPEELAKMKAQLKQKNEEIKEANAIVPLNMKPPVNPEPKSLELAQVEARTISKFAEASVIEYSEAEKQILFAPIKVADIKVRPDGQIYLEWAWYAERLDAAFGPGQWSLSPAPWNPRLYRENNITYREYVLWIRGNFAGNAVGHHEEQRKTANFGDAAEATYANALTRCCKRIGIARDLWKKDKIEQFKQLMRSKNKTSGSTTTIEVEKVVQGPTGREEGREAETSSNQGHEPPAPSLSPTVHKLIDAFGSIGVDLTQLEQALGKKIGEIEDIELKNLRVVYKRMEAGKTFAEAIGA